MNDRHQRVESLIAEFAASFILREANTDPMLTVPRVSTSTDHKSLTVYFTTTPDGRENDALIFLKRSGRELRHYIKKQSNLKIIPNIDFAIDVGERHRQHVDELVRESGVESTFEELKEKESK